jgi:hypothetical protein
MRANLNVNRITGWRRNELVFFYGAAAQGGPWHPHFLGI